jgi:hypothetical protein
LEAGEYKSQLSSPVVMSNITSITTPSHRRDSPKRPQKVSFTSLATTHAYPQMYGAKSASLPLTPSAVDRMDCIRGMKAAIDANHSSTNLCFKVVSTDSLAALDSQALQGCRSTSNSGRLSPRTLQPQGSPSAATVSSILRAIAESELRKSRAIQLYMRKIGSDEDRDEEDSPREGTSACISVSFFDNMKWEDLPLREFAKNLLQSDSFKGALQVYVDQLNTLPEGLENLAIDSLETLVYHKHGCHVLRRLLPKSKKLTAAAIDFSRKRIIELSTQEYSSRVLQQLVLLDPQFRDATLRKFSIKLTLLTRNLSAIFLLTACLKHSPNPNPIISKIGDQLLRSVVDNQLPRFTKRVLVSYVEYCTEDRLDQFYHALGFETSFASTFNDKYMVYIFRLYLIRGHQQARRTFLESVSSDLPSLMRTKFFTFLMMKIYNDERSRALLLPLNSSLLQFLVKETHRIQSLLHAGLLPRHERSASIRPFHLSDPETLPLWLGLWLTLSSPAETHPPTSKSVLEQLLITLQQTDRDSASPVLPSF